MKCPMIEFKQQWIPFRTVYFTLAWSSNRRLHLGSGCSCRRHLRPSGNSGLLQSYTYAAESFLQGLRLLIINSAFLIANPLHTLHKLYQALEEECQYISLWPLMYQTKDKRSQISTSCIASSHKTHGNL